MGIRIMGSKQFLVIPSLLLVAGIFSPLPFEAFAQEPQGQEEDLYEMPASRMIRIDEKTIKRGITFSAGSGEIVIGILPKSLSSSATLGMEFDALRGARLPEGWAHASHGWGMKLSLEGEDNGVEILKPFAMVVRVPQKDFVYHIARWDETRGRWLVLPTTQRWKHQEVRTFLKQQGTYTLLKDTRRHLRGKATWYPDRLSKDTRFAAASNEYPLRTKLKVTNVQTDESVMVTVQSVGPFVKGRIIDLTKTAFSKIGYPRKQGVLQVAVEQVTK